MAAEERPVSLEDKLVELHKARIAEAEAMIEDSRQDIGRISLIYSGQLQLDFEGATR